MISLHKVKKIPLLLILELMKVLDMEIPPKATTAVLINKGNKILMLKLSYKNGYSLPGGSVMEDETFEEAAKREVKEEIGTNVTRLKYFGSFIGKKKFYSNILVCFNGKLANDKFSSNWEGKPEWIDLEKAERLCVFNDVKQAVHQYIEQQSLL